MMTQLKLSHMKNKIYSYPALSERDYGWFRVGGPGLANCMFFAAKAYVYAKCNDAKFIEPTWTKFSIGPWLRGERDKRIYVRLFRHFGTRGLKKILLINPLKFRKIHVVKFDSLGNYFGDINEHHDLVEEYFSKIVLPDTISNVKESELIDAVAVHVRLGDYLPHLRVDMKWYRGIIESILTINPDQEILIFSDGTDEELKPLLEVKNVKRVFYGNAFADMWAISKSKLVIASDSTFSAWGAFIGNKPIIFSKRHFPPVYKDDSLEAVLGEEITIPEKFKKLISDESI